MTNVRNFGRRTDAKPASGPLENQRDPKLTEREAENLNRRGDAGQDAPPPPPPAPVKDQWREAHRWLHGNVRHLHVEAATVQAILKVTGVDPVTAAERAQLGQLQSKWDALTGALSEFDTVAVKAEINRQLRMTGDDVVSGAAAGLESRPALEHRYKVSRGLIKSSRKAVTAESIAIWRAVAIRVQAACRRFVDNELKREQDAAKEFGVPFTPSAQLIGASFAASELIRQFEENVAPGITQTAPRGPILGFLKLA